MRYLSKWDLERLAIRVVSAYRKLPDAKLDPLRVDPEILLNQLLNLSIDYRHLSKNRKTLGLTAYDEIAVEVGDSNDEEFYFLDGKTVLIEEDLRDIPGKIGRLNFTKVHEGCHHILNMVFPGEYTGGMNARRVLRYRMPQADQKRRDWEEWQVDNLSSAILMPEQLLRSNMKRCGLSEKIDVLNRVYRRDTFLKFEELSYMMGVSKQALAIRMKYLGLLEKEYLANPYDLVNVYMEEGEYDGRKDDQSQQEVS